MPETEMPEADRRRLRQRWQTRNWARRKKGRGELSWEAWLAERGLRDPGRVARASPRRYSRAATDRPNAEPASRARSRSG